MNGTRASSAPPCPATAGYPIPTILRREPSMRGMDVEEDWRPFLPDQPDNHHACSHDRQPRRKSHRPPRGSKQAGRTAGDPAETADQRGGAADRPPFPIPPLGTMPWSSLGFSAAPRFPAGGQEGIHRAARQGGRAADTSAGMNQRWFRPANATPSARRRVERAEANSSSACQDKGLTWEISRRNFQLTPTQLVEP